MAEHSTIEWTEATWNPITGCSLESPGCTNCYAMALAGTRLKNHPSRAGLTKMTKAGPVWTGEVRFNEQWLDQPLRWRRPRLIFVCAHADLFHPNVPDEWIDKIFAVMALAPQHTFQVLTKRAERMRTYVENPSAARRVWDAACEMRDTIWALAMHGAAWGGEAPWPLRNVWLGVSVEDQKRADERIPDLLATPAAVRWLSMEPLLGPVTFEGRFEDQPNPAVHINWLEALDWVVLGGESGDRARPMHPDWARSVRDQCAAAGVPFHFKQHGSWYHAWANDYAVDEASIRGAYIWGEPSNGRADVSYLLGKKPAGRLLDGVEHNGVPA